MEDIKSLLEVIGFQLSVPLIVCDWLKVKQAMSVGVSWLSRICARPHMWYGSERLEKFCFIAVFYVIVVNKKKSLDLFCVFILN